MSHQERWQLDANPDEQYERYLVPAMFAPWASDLVELAEPHLGERVLDVACGTGVVARLMASHVGETGKVVDLDFAAGRLSVARSHIPTQGVEVEGLQFFPDRLTAIRKMYRVLIPGGRLLLSVWRSIEHHRTPSRWPQPSSVT